MIDKEGGPHCGPPSCRSASLGSSPIAPFDRLFAGFLLLGRVLELALRHPGYEHIARAGKTCGGQRCDPVADFDRPRLPPPATGLAQVPHIPEHLSPRIGARHTRSDREPNSKNAMAG